MELQNYKIIPIIENRIRNNDFATKEELVKHLQSIKTNSVLGSELTKEKITELLNLYDYIHKETKIELNTENYKDAKLEDQRMIISKEENTVLDNSYGDKNIAEEFAAIQNEIAANSNDGLANSNEVYNHLKNNVKKDVKFMPLSEFKAEYVSDTEILNKIRFFLSSDYIKTNNVSINPENGFFYNFETNEILEVRKNSQTDKYEIYRSGEVIYKENAEDKEIDKDATEKEEEKENTKARRLIKPNDIDSRAYIRSSFIVIGITIITVIITAIIIINK